MATLDITTRKNEEVQVMLYYGNKNYLLCNLNKDSLWQVPLDLTFKKGIDVTFTCNGQSKVYLTGYFIFNENLALHEEKEERLDDTDDNNANSYVEKIQIIPHNKSKKRNSNSKSRDKISRN